MEKYVMAAALYLLGIGLYFVFNLFIHETLNGYIEIVHKETPVQLSDGVLSFIIVMVVLLISFIWPFSTIYDLVTTLKGEHENDNSATG